MHIILGGTGNVGSAVAQALLKRHEPIIVVTHDSSKATSLRQGGADVAVADVHDVIHFGVSFVKVGGCSY